MTKDIKSIDDWSDAFDQILEDLARTRNVVEGLAKHGVRSSDELYQKTEGLKTLLSTIEEASRDLRYYFCMNPLHKFLKGHQLTKEEFYLLAAYGVWKIPSTTGSGEAYEEFTYRYYEDNELYGYINPSQKPFPPRSKNGSLKFKTSLTWGIVPEEVRISFLRTDQLNYFKDYKPKEFSRFRKD